VAEGKAGKWGVCPESQYSSHDGNLNNIQHGLDVWKKGVSGVKVVMEL
jgi:hypothetical protein